MDRPHWSVPLALVWVSSFFLHFAWEMWQVVFYEGMATASHAAAIWICTKATFGDANIALAAYLAAALSVCSIDWVRTPTGTPLFFYLAAGLLITVLFEYLATEVLGRWEYNEQMPTLPLLGTGLLPLAQWIVVPLVSLYATRLMYFGFLPMREYAANKPA
ncbi:hypothetical protein [Allohahella marinimesophila]|uniref:Rod shape-determining protein MreD n=1 Tax=Allohahella marinimesophila TaxID=1054972 RepID=A0ABP7Q917_9GAMM